MGGEHEHANGNRAACNDNGEHNNGNGADHNGNGEHSNGNGCGSNGNGAGSKNECELQKCKPKRDILKLLKECDISAKEPVEEKCCSWHKYIIYGLPLALYLPWLFKMAHCPPRCCPPRYCCPREKPICPPPKLKCGPKASSGPRPCPPEPEAPPRECPHDA